jgi:hypothetical protein
LSFADNAAESGVYGPERKWLIEGHGVEPDMVVDNLPQATFNGSDAQLDAAIKQLAEAIAKDPRPVPEPPAYPDKASSASRNQGGDKSHKDPESHCGAALKPSF